MATQGTQGFSGGNQIRTFEKCRKVGIPMTAVGDGDTVSVGPGLLTVAWEATGGADTGEVHCFVTDRTAGTVEFDTGGADRVGTLWCFYGTSGRTN